MTIKVKAKAFLKRMRERREKDAARLAAIVESVVSSAAAVVMAAQDARVPRRPFMLAEKEAKKFGASEPMPADTVFNTGEMVMPSTPKVRLETVGGGLRAGKTFAARAFAAYAAGTMSVDEVRAMFGLDPIEGIDPVKSQSSGTGAQRLAPKAELGKPGDRKFRIEEKE
jgi:hypothetical protein